MDRWGYEHCGFGTLDVTGTGTDLPGVPATLPAGPLAVKFDNGGDPATRGFVLLVAKVRDGAQYTLDGIRDGSVDFNSVADVVGAAQPPAGESTGYAVSTLTPGRYLVVSPIGTPPALHRHGGGRVHGDLTPRSAERDVRPQPGATSETCAATTRQPGANRTQVWLCRPSTAPSG